jgi:hypothetical protein
LRSFKPQRGWDDLLPYRHNQRQSDLSQVSPYRNSKL